MDKKNTMLLTVIAVATLLVAVVGATFAFFAVNKTPDPAETKFTGSAQSIPVIAVNPGDDLNLVVSATDMDQSNVGNYYAIQGETGNEGEGTSRWATSSKQHIMSSIAATGGTAGDNYTCNYTITVTATGTMVAELKEDDVKVVLYDTNSNLSLDSEATTGYNLLSTSATKTFTGSVTLDGASGVAGVKADLILKNDEVRDQSKLAGKGLEVKVNTALTECKLVTE